MDLINIQQLDCEQLKAEIERLKQFMMTARMTEEATTKINNWIAEAEKKVASCHKKRLYGGLTPLIIIVGVVAAGFVAYKLFKK